MGLSKEGFKRKSYNDLLNDISAKTKEQFGADANVAERSALGIIIRLMAWFLSLAWQAIEHVYHGGYRKTAEGNQLDMLLPLAGVTRNLEDYAYGEVTLTGTPHHTVTSGFLFGKEKSDITYETLYDVTLDGNGAGTVEVICSVIGSIGNTAAGTVTVIENPSADVIAVTNVNKIDGGREKETDAEAKARADITVDGMGNGTPPAIRTAILNVPGVRAAQVIENYLVEFDEYGTPKNAFQSFVLGGSDEEIVTAILNAKAGGIQPYGTTYKQALDLSGNSQRVGFTRATEVILHAKVVITKNAEFETDGVNQVKNALVQYIGGADTSAQLFIGLNMGEKVVLAKGMAKILAVKGITDVELSFSTDGITFTEENVLISVYQVAQIDAANIEVTVNV